MGHNEKGSGKNKTLFFVLVAVIIVPICPAEIYAL